MTLALGPGPEFDRIRAIAGALGKRAASLGDDCAVLQPEPGALCVSTDASVEGVHFRLDWVGLEECGWRAAAAALSDLAAEGARAAAVLASVIAPPTATETEVVALMRGIGGATAEVGARVVGGDLTRGEGKWAVVATVLGWSDRPVTRAGAVAGDGIWVTGTLGGARAALESWRRGEAPEPAAREAFTRPSPRIAAGRWLAAHGARAMLDVSDGLAGDAGHLAAASGIGLDLELELVPVHPATIEAAARAGVPVQQFAAEGGEDFELLVALPDDFGARDVRAFEQATGLALTRIGHALRGSGVRSRLAGRPLVLYGYDHFR